MTVQVLIEAEQTIWQSHGHGHGTRILTEILNARSGQQFLRMTKSELILHSILRTQQAAGLWP